MATRERRRVGAGRCGTIRRTPTPSRRRAAPPCRHGCRGYHGVDAQRRRVGRGRGETIAAPRPSRRCAAPPCGHRCRGYAESTRVSGRGGGAGGTIAAPHASRRCAAPPCGHRCRGYAESRRGGSGASAASGAALDRNLPRRSLDDLADERVGRCAAGGEVGEQRVEAIARAPRSAGRPRSGRRRAAARRARPRRRQRDLRATRARLRLLPPGIDPSARELAHARQHGHGGGARAARRRCDAASKLSQVAEQAEAGDVGGRRARRAASAASRPRCSWSSAAVDLAELAGSRAPAS